MKKQHWVRVAQLADIPVRGARRLKYQGTTIALFRTVDNTVYAIGDQCPHKGGPLSQGIVHDNCVTCPLHNWVISLETGEAQGADEGQVSVYLVKIEEDTVLIDVSNHVEPEPAGIQSIPVSIS